jgi:CRP-like cAMP-binding protein
MLQKVSDFMYNHPLFLNVDLKKYENYFHIKKYPQNTLLFHEGEECKDIGIILKGQLTISTMTSLNKEYIINILNKNDLFGDTLLFSKKTLFLGDGIISKDAEILFISKELLLEMFKEQQFLLNFLSITSQKSMNLRNRLKLLSHKSIEERILFYLTEQKKQLNSNKIPIKSKESLAKLLNIPRPSLSRELIKLKERKIIDYNRYYIILII